MTGERIPPRAALGRNDKNGGEVGMPGLCTGFSTGFVGKSGFFGQKTY